MWEYVHNILAVGVVLVLLIVASVTGKPVEISMDGNKAVGTASGVYHNFINNFSNGRGGAGSF